MKVSSLITSAPSWIQNLISVSDAPASRPVKNLAVGEPYAITPVTSQATLNPRRDVLRRTTLNRPRAVENSRFFREKLGIFKALYENTSRYVLGRGLMPTSLCRDEEWASMANDHFSAWAGEKTFDYREEMTFAQLQKVVLPDVMTDGDCGAVPVIGQRGMPCIQMFPTDAIGSVPGQSIFDGRGTWDEGVLRYEGGPAIAYRVIKSRTWKSPTGTAGYFDYAADRFFHVGRVDRINSNRPMPWLYHGEDCGLNIIDVKALELAARKLNSYFAATLHTASGEMPDSMADVVEAQKKNYGTTTDPKELESTIANLIGAAAVVPLKEDEELKMLGNGRDSMSTIEFLNYLEAEIASGFGVPIQFVRALTGMTGPYTRLVLQQADWFFMDVADMMVSDFCQPIWLAFIQHQMATGKLRAPAAGSNWREVQWQGPGSITIDKGRDGKLMLDMIKHGLYRAEDWHEMTGKNGERANRKIVESKRKIMDLCDEYEVPYHFILGPEYKDQAPGAAPDPAADPAGGSDIDALAERVAEIMREAQDEG